MKWIAVVGWILLVVVMVLAILFIPSALLILCINTLLGSVGGTSIPYTVWTLLSSFGIIALIGIKVSK